jgi:hypothetical protein
MNSRFEARMNSQTGLVAVVDTVSREVVRVVGGTAAAMREALAECDQLNELERQFQASEHSAESFAQLWRQSVNA